ncbi:MAG: hypothetical protein HUK21_04330 [Fibrobacteraceae bacterium]|nr:hypothetical protein [Fibrobacteraceae bacterium]
MVKKFISNIILCGFLFCCFVASSCGPVEDYPYGDLHISADTPKGVDSVYVCISPGDSNFICSKDDIKIIREKNFSDSSAEENRHSIYISDFMALKEVEIQVKFHCAAGTTATEPYRISTYDLYYSHYFFWNYEERFLGGNDYQFKLIRFVPPADTLCGKMVNYALMTKEIN